MCRFLFVCALSLSAVLMNCRSVLAYELTGYTGADCSGCGYYWPWSPSCRDGSPTTIRTGFYREYNGTRGSASCHQNDNPLPHCEPVTFLMGDTYTYSLESGEWSWFGLTWGAGWETTVQHSISPSNCCNTTGCCLVPMKAYVRWEYEQVVVKQQIAKTYWVYPGTSQHIPSGWEDCVACNANTRKFGVLKKFPTPELLPAAQAVVLPYDAPLMTLAEYCGN